MFNFLDIVAQCGIVVTGILTSFLYSWKNKWGVVSSLAMSKYHHWMMELYVRFSWMLRWFF